MFSPIPFPCLVQHLFVHIQDTHAHQMELHPPNQDASLVSPTLVSCSLFCLPCGNHLRICSRTTSFFYVHKGFPILGDAQNLLQQVFRDILFPTIILREGAHRDSATMDILGLLFLPILWVDDLWVALSRFPVIHQSQGASRRLLIEFVCMRLWRLSPLPCFQGSAQLYQRIWLHSYERLRLPAL